MAEDSLRSAVVERVPTPAIESRGALFRQELVQTPADGAPSLLSNPA